MEPFTVETGRVMPLDRSDVDTDQIMPKQFLKRVERVGFGEFVFHDWRREPDFVFNDPAYAGAAVLVSGPNFGAGSSREHAPWGLQQYGFRVIVAPSFGDIFATNCAQIGLLTVEISSSVCRDLIDRALRDPRSTVTVDLAAQELAYDDVIHEFEVDPRRRRMLLEGLDQIELTLRRGSEVEAHEAQRPAWMPVTTEAIHRLAASGPAHFQEERP